MAGNKVIIRGAYLNYLHLLTTLVSLVVLTPILLRFLGRAAYGLWAVFGSIMSYFMLCDFGMNTAVAKYVAEYRVLNQREKLRQIVSTAFLLLCILGGIIVLLSLGLSYFILQMFGVSEDFVPGARIAFVLVGVNVALGLVGGVFGNVLYGYERIDVWKVSGIVQQIVNVGLTLWFLQLGFGLIGVAAASTASTLALICLYLFSLRLSGYGIIIDSRCIERRVIKEIMPYCIRTFILGVTSRLLYYTDNVVIGIFLGVALVTPYEIVYKLSFCATYLFSVISTTAFPRFASLYTRGDYDGLGDLYVKIAKVCVVIMVGVGLGLVFLGRSFIGLWVGEENYAGTDVLLLLVIMNVFHAIGSPAAALLQGIGRNKELMYSEIINAGLNVVLSITLVTRMGLPGVVLGTLLAHVFTSLWVVLLLPCRYANISLRRYLSTCIFPPLLAALPGAAVVWIVMQGLSPGGTFLELALRGATIVLIYCAIYLVVGATGEERQMYVRLVRGRA